MSNETDPTSPTSPSSLKQKLKSSLRLPWLRHHGHHGSAQSASATPLPSASPSPRANNNNHTNMAKLISGTLSPTWLKSQEIKDKCRSLINRIGHAGHGHGHNGHGHHGHGHQGHGHHGHGHLHRRRHSADFRYDPSSYALNFDEGSHDRQLDEFPMRSFSARLPRSPPPGATTSSEITTYT